MQSRNEQAFQENPIHQDNPLYTADEMAVVIEYKKQKRLKKGTYPSLICFVLKNNEFKSFIKLLRENRASLLDETRFQFVYEFDGHGLSGDVRVKDGRLEFFIFDSLHSIINLKPIINNIKRYSSRAIITYASGGKIQTRDFKNCGSFALDHAFNMNKIVRLHESIKQLAQRPSETNDDVAKFFNKHVRNGTLLTLPISRFPLEFGPLLRNMQSVSTLKDQFFNKGYQGSNKNSLKRYVKKNLTKLETDGVSKKINYSIENKRNKFKAKAEKFFNELDREKRKDVITNRKDMSLETFTSKSEEEEPFNNSHPASK